jgi:hypothetical protein
MSATVTVCIPLHNSARWVENVVSNVRQLPPSVTEILVSDRTMSDNAAAVLRDRLADDPRVRVIEERRGCWWPEHCQLLLDEAAGDLVMLLPHDDNPDATWVPDLVAALDRHPGALLAFGRITLVDEDGRTPRRWQPRHPAPGLISADQAINLLVADGAWLGFRGLHRKQALRNACLTLATPPRFPRRGYWGVDQLWVFAMALSGGVIYEPAVGVRKRMHAHSATAVTGRARPGRREFAAIPVLWRHAGRGRVRGTFRLLLAGTNALVRRGR